MMLYKLLAHLNRDRFDVNVIALMDGGAVRTKIERLGIDVYSLGMSKGRLHLSGVMRLVKRLREHPPDLIQSWMYHADLVGGGIGKLFTRAPIVWNIQASDIVHNPDHQGTVMAARSCAFLSPFVPNKIVSCSEAACRIHAKLGYKADKLLPIPNGVELAGFQADGAARISVRDELKLAHSTPLIGMAARFHPQKDHYTFLQAAARLHRVRPDVHFVFCGYDVTWESTQLADWITEADLQKHCHLLGERADMPRMNASFDIATLSSSYGEGFPNVLGEAMACEVPCVVTDVGDSSLIVGDTGIVVPPRDPEALAQGWLKLLQMNPEERKALGRAARERAQTKFGLSHIVARYEQLYADLLALPK